MPVETSGGASRAAESVTVTTFNTVTLSHGNVYRLVTPFCGTYYFNVLNLGPCAVYIRADADPAVDDPHSEMLPAGFADNSVLVPDGTKGLRFLAGPPCRPPCPCPKEDDKDKDGDKDKDQERHVARITVRLVRG